jgi:hypothetical protein
MLRRLPSPFLIFAATMAFLFGIVVAARGLVDSDYYWHVVAGRIIATTGSVPQVDPFSFTWAGQPWTMHEWLGELLIYWLVSAFGAGVATFLFGMLSIGGPLVVAGTLRRLGVSMRALFVPTALVAYVFASYGTIRPQVISWLFLGFLLAVLLTLRPEQRWRPWLLVPLFVLWANIHGLYVVGGGVLGLYAVFTLLGLTAMAPARGRMVGVLALSFLGSMLTPAGPEGLLYPLRYVDAGDWGLAHISEWQSPNFHDISQLGLLLLISALLLNGMRATPSWLVAVATLGIAGALLATRNAPVAALLTLPTLALGVADRWRSRVQSGPTPQRVQVGRRLMELTAAVVVIAAAILIVPRLPAVAGASVISRNFPVVAVDQLEERQPDARVLAEYHWGGYVINRLYDKGGRVFVEGRNDMYSDRILDDYVSIRNAQAGWLDLVDRYGVQAIVLPPDAAVTQGAATANGWCEAYRDNVAVLLLKTCAALGGG